MGKINWEQPHVPGVCVTPGRCTWLCGGFSLLPPFLLSFLLLFSSPQSKQASPCPIWLMNPEISPALVITRDRWPGEIPGGCSPARGSHRELQLTDFAPGHPKGWQQLFPTFQAVGCGGIHGGIHGGITPWWSPRGLYSQCGTCSIPPSFSLFPLSSAVCLAGNKKKKKNHLFPPFFPSLCYGGCSTGALVGTRTFIPLEELSAPLSRGSAGLVGFQHPVFWAGGGLGALAGAGPARAALFLSPCLERFSLYQRLRVFSAGD